MRSVASADAQTLGRQRQDAYARTASHMAVLSTMILRHSMPALEPHIMQHIYVYIVDIYCVLPVYIRSSCSRQLPALHSLV